MNLYYSKISVTILILWFSFGGQLDQSKNEMLLFNGAITFISDAPLEWISAKSLNLKGLIDTTSNKFAFEISVSTFDGFNSALQKEHFNENYLETGVFPKATYSGKILDRIDWSKPGKYIVRTKGMLNIHGQAVERIIKNTIDITSKEVLITSDFTVPLEDHNIRIPKIVENKISPLIQVQLNANIVR